MLANNCTAVKLIQAKIVQKAGWAQGPVWTGTENLAPIGVNPRPLQHSKSLYRLSSPGPRFRKSIGWVGLLKENEFVLTKSREDLQVV